MKLLLHTDSPSLYSGLGRCGRELAKRFYSKIHLNNENKEEHDFEIYYAAWHYLSTRHEFPYFIYPLQKGAPNEDKQLKDILFDCNPDVILSVGDIWNFYPIYQIIREYKETHLQAKWVVWLTIDGEHLHPTWKQILDYADDINVFSCFAQNEIFKFSGIRTNIIYPGVDNNVFRSIDTKVTQNTLPFKLENTFLVVNINQNTDRKNIPITLEAFKDFAQDKEDVFLLLVTDPRDPFGYDLWDFVKMFNLNKKAAITKEAGPLHGMSDAQLNLIYNLASVSINTSIGEGLSLPTLEAMSVGTPVMATDYAAISELLNQGGGIKLKVAGYLYGFNGIKRALVSKDNIVENLNVLYDDFKSDKKIHNYISEKSKKFTKGLTWDKTAEFLMQRINYALEKKTFNFVHEKIKVKNINPLIVIPSWGTNCGIAEYTKALFDAVRAKGQQAVVFGSYNYNEIPKIVEEGHYNVVNIQHEFSFFKEKEILGNLLKQLNSMKVKTILTLHSFVPGMVSYNKLLLTHVDDLIVHTEIFKERLGRYFSEDKVGFIPKICNIEVMPMGCGKKHEFNIERIKETKKNLKIDNRFPIIGSFGFLRDQKGFKEFLLGIKMLEKEYPDILALLVCPKHEFGSATYDDAFFNFIERHELSNRVLIIREYLTEEKLLDVLQCADLFVLNYQDAPLGGGVSAAVKTLFRVQRPIIVNDGIAFCDLKNEVLKINSAELNHLVDSVRRVLNDKTLSNQLISAANIYIEKNNWDIVAQKHLDLYAR